MYAAVMNNLFGQDVLPVSDKVCITITLNLGTVVSCLFTLQICLIFDMSFPCRCWRLGFINGQVSLAWSIGLRTQELCTRPHVLKERWLEERTGISSVKFFMVVFTDVVVLS